MESPRSTPDEPDYEYQAGDRPSPRSRRQRWLLDPYENYGRYPQGIARYRGPFAQPAEQDHRGIGPKGYRREDQRIWEDVCEAFTDDPWLDPSDISVLVSEGEVSLKGTVRSREERRLADELCHLIVGVQGVENELRVAYS